MCGRYADFLELQDLMDAFVIDTVTESAAAHAARYNIAPLQDVRIVRVHHNQRVLDTARWGLVPRWAKDTSAAARTINARLETASTKPSFRAAFASRRCVIPASGYYEWQSLPTGKTPHFIHPSDSAPLAMAGLYEAWRASEAEPWLVTCSVLTTAASAPLADIHDRRPVMLSHDDEDAWLDPASDGEAAMAAALGQAPELAWHPVSAAVGNVRNDYPELAQPATDSLF